MCTHGRPFIDYKTHAAWTLTAALYELLANPHEVAKLKAELASVPVRADGIPALADVEGLPFLGAVIQEAVRLHPGVMARQMRVSPDVALRYTNRATGREYVVPTGTVYSASPLDTHMHEEAFEDPYRFLPSRWIDNPKLSRYFHGFARGSRNCVGYVVSFSFNLVVPLFSRSFLRQRKSSSYS